MLCDLTALDWDSNACRAALPADPFRSGMCLAQSPGRECPEMQCCRVRGKFHCHYYLRISRFLKNRLFTAVVFGNEQFLDLKGKSLHP